METGVDTALRRVIAEVGFLEARWSDVRPRIVEEHRALFDAIAAGDGATASDLANRHVRT
jgi:GntR family transcriptional regulator, transcriptional repressor for pyruvate dehydrogenase complex